MRRAAVLTVTALLLAVGCGADETPSSGGAASSSTAEPSEPTEPTEPTDEPSSTAQPAAGPTIDTPGLTVTVPKGFEEREISGRNIISAVDLLPDDRIVLSFQGDYGDYSLDELATFDKDSASSLQGIPRADDVEIDGVPAYHFAGENDLRTVDVFGAGIDQNWMIVSFELNALDQPRKREQIVESTLATLTWK